MFYELLRSPVGELLLVGNEQGLKMLIFQDGKHPQAIDSQWKKNRQPFQDIIAQLKAYFEGDLTKFSMKLSPDGTDFQQKVWKALRRIPYGKTVSYGEIAKQIGNPHAARAVGAANGQNPISIIVPCHRVIGANGRLVGYGGGLPIKQSLLALEQHHGRARW
ncbi:MAG: methylated-DNA--protein-cysteine methyltransferase [Nitrospirales bacterium]|nr:MAG: methylated-DNA--protein-cysteine methyltransferase [Nitrospirales bacterium]